MSTHTMTSPRASPRPRASQSEEPCPEVRVYVWDIVVRLTHWTIAFSILILAITGAYMGSPYLISVGEARDHFTMGTMKVVHFYAAAAFTIAVIARIVWMFIGSSHANWREFLPVESIRLKGLVQTLRFYLGIGDVALPWTGHNPLAGFTYLFVFVLYLVMIATGLGLYAMSAHIESPFRWFVFLNELWGGAQTARWIHHIVMWLLIGFVVHHIFSGLLVSASERNATMESMFSGFKWVKQDDLDLAKKRFSKRSRS